MSSLNYIRYLQVDYIVLSKHLNNNVERLNLWAFKVGILAQFGACIVGNFQETYMLTEHWIGATMVFGLNSIYVIMQVIFV